MMERELVAFKVKTEQSALHPHLVEKSKLNGRINKAVSTINISESFFNTVRTNVGRLDIVIEVFKWTE